MQKKTLGLQLVYHLDSGSLETVPEATTLKSSDEDNPIYSAKETFRKPLYASTSHLDTGTTASTRVPGLSSSDSQLTGSLPSTQLTLSQLFQGLTVSRPKPLSDTTFEHTSPLKEELQLRSGSLTPDQSLHHPEGSISSGHQGLQLPPGPQGLQPPPGPPTQKLQGPLISTPPPPPPTHTQPRI